MSTVYKLFKPLLLLMVCLPMLSCDRLFDDRPKTMTIEYDEEVKLHDGEMIWVHITRHYVLAGGGALGDPGAFERHYFPKEVEISWDTGFEGVGRKSVFFDALVTIDKYDDTWYIGGAKNNSFQDINGSVSCDNYGIFVKGYKCIIAINKYGFVELDTNIKDRTYANFKAGERNCSHK